MPIRRLAWLDEVFRENEPRAFLYWQGQPFTYGWLRAAFEEGAKLLEEHGIGAGSTVALDGDYSPRAVADLLALIDAGCIVIPLSPAARLQKDEFLAIAEAQYVVRLTAEDGHTVERRDATPANPLLRQLAVEGDPGLVLFSSGSTGKSKAALHNFRLILEKFRTRRPAFVTITFLMLDHIGGINTLFYVLSNGGTAVTLASRIPEEVCAAIGKFHVELLPTSPTFLNLLLLSEAHKTHDLSSLRRITYGTEVMPESLLTRLHAEFPGVELQQTYGLSELGILRSKSRDSGSLWMKVGGEGYAVRVENGTLWIKARSAMLGYLNAPSPFREDGWFDTGDAVEVEGDYLRVLGRKSELINVGGEKVYPAEVEAALLGMVNVVDVSVFGAPSPITGQIVCARFTLLEPEEPAAFRRRVRSFCAGKLAAYKTPAKILITEDAQHSERFKKMRRPQ